jgi:recombinational DNA repair ATPase RecF
MHTALKAIFHLLYKRHPQDLSTSSYLTGPRERDLQIGASALLSIDFASTGEK